MAIKFSTNAGLSSPSYSNYRIEKFNGVDYTNTPTSVDDSRAIDMSNYLPEGNALIKRYGYETLLYKVLDKYEVINIWKYKRHYVIYVRNADMSYGLLSTLRLDDEDGYDHIKLGEGKTDCIYSDGNEIKYTGDNKYSFGIEYDNRLFLLVANSYLMIYEKEGNLEAEYVNSKNSYIPTTVIGIGDKNSGDKSKLLEGFNLLSNKCYMEVILYPNADSLDVTYEYDLQRYLVNKEIEEVYVIDGAGKHLISANTSHYLFNFATILYENKTLKINTPSIKNLNANHLTQDQIEDGDSYDYLKEYMSNDACSVKLEITYKADNSMTVKNMRFGALFGYGNDNDVLFLSGNSDYPNMDIWSGICNDSEEDWKNLTYFPDNNYQLFGDGSSAVIGYGYLNNGYMAIFKESSSNQSNVYFRESTSMVDDDGNTIIYYPITISGINIEATKNSMIFNYANYLMINSPHGIYRVEATTSTATQTYEGVEMSYLIRNDLGNDLSGSCIGFYDGKLLIARKNKEGKLRIYVADKDRYTFNDSKKVFEWWIMDGIEPYNFFIEEDSLYFTSPRGLCAMTNYNKDNVRYRFNSVNVYDLEQVNDLFYDDENKVFGIYNDNDIITRILNSNNVYNEYKALKNDSRLLTNNVNEIILTGDYETYEYDEETGEQITTSHAGNVISVSYVERFIKDLSVNSEVLTGANPYLYENTINIVMTKKQYNELYDILNNIKNVSCPFGYNYTFSYSSKIRNDGKVEAKIILNYIRKANEDFGIISDGSSSSIVGENAIKLFYKVKLDESKIEELYAYDPADKHLIAFGDCVLGEDGIWYYSAENTYREIGSFTDVIFNLFSLENNDSIQIENGTINIVGELYLDVDFPINSYWYGKYTDLGSIGVLKTTSSITFLPDSRYDGFTNVAYRTLKTSASFSAFRHYKTTLDFNNIDFDYFAFGTGNMANIYSDMATTYTSKKKIKNFAFMQLRFTSVDERQSTIAEINIRYRTTKYNKGVK